MSIQARISAIKSSKNTTEIIKNYGDFVEYYQNFESKLKSRIKKRGDRGWTNDRVTLSKIQKSVSSAQLAIYNIYGGDIMLEAINKHPFK